MVVERELAAMYANCWSAGESNRYRSQHGLLGPIIPRQNLFHFNPLTALPNSALSINDWQLYFNNRITIGLAGAAKISMDYWPSPFESHLASPALLSSAWNAGKFPFQQSYLLDSHITQNHHKRLTNSFSVKWIRFGPNRTPRSTWITDKLHVSNANHNWTRRRYQIIVDYRPVSCLSKNLIWLTTAHHQLGID